MFNGKEWCLSSPAKSIVFSSHTEKETLDFFTFKTFSIDGDGHIHFCVNLE